MIEKSCARLAIFSDSVIMEGLTESDAERYHGSVQHPVFIVGSPRSGTSALVDLLHCVGYHGFLEGNFLTLLHYVNAIVDRHYGWFPSNDRDVMLSNLDKSALKRRLFETFRAVMNDLNPQEPWFDKTGNPEMILAIPILRELWPGSAFVFAKRRGIENVISRMKKFPSYTFEYHCSNWARNMLAWRRIRTQIPAECFVEVEQHNMVQQPEITARKLCAFLQLDDSKVPAAATVMDTCRPQETTKGSAFRISSLAASGWTKEQTETFLKHCGTEMKAFGYTLDEQYSVNA